MAVEDPARATHLVARGFVEPGDEQRGLNRGAVEQDLGVGHRVQRRRVDDHHRLAAVAEFRDDLADHGACQELGRVVGQRSGGEHAEIGERRQRLDEQVGRRVATQQRRRQTAPRVQPEVARERRHAQVELEQHDAALGQRDHLRKVDRDGRLALAGAALVTSSVSIARVTAANSRALRRMR